MPIMQSGLKIVKTYSRYWISHFPVAIEARAELLLAIWNSRPFSKNIWVKNDKENRIYIYIYI